MPTVIAFGHVISGEPFQYGPLKFEPNWNGLFTALEIGEHVQKLAVSFEDGIGGAAKDIAGNSVTVPWPSKASERAQDFNRDRLLLSLEQYALHLEHMRITLEKKGRIRDERYVRFGDAPAEQVGDALIEMGLNGWGYVREIVMAMIKFSAVGDEDAHHRCIHLFFVD